MNILNELGNYSQLYKIISQFADYKGEQMVEGYTRKGMELRRLRIEKERLEAKKKQPEEKLRKLYEQLIR